MKKLLFLFIFVHLNIVNAQQKNKNCYFVYNISSVMTIDDEIHSISKLELSWDFSKLDLTTTTCSIEIVPLYFCDDMSNLSAVGKSLIISSKDKDFLKPVKQNNILGYIMFIMMLELNDSQISYINSDKKGFCNFQIFDKIYTSLFENLKFRKNNKGDTFPRLQVKAYDLTDEDQFREFVSGNTVQITVPGTDKKIPYESERKTGVLVSKVGAEKAISIGAYAFALYKLDSLGFLYSNNNQL